MILGTYRHGLDDRPRSKTWEFLRLFSSLSDSSCLQDQLTRQRFARILEGGTYRGKYQGLKRTAFEYALTHNDVLPLRREVPKHRFNLVGADMFVL